MAILPNMGLLGKMNLTYLSTLIYVQILTKRDTKLLSTGPYIIPILVRALSAFVHLWEVMPSKVILSRKRVYLKYEVLFFQLGFLGFFIFLGSVSYSNGEVSPIPTLKDPNLKVELVAEGLNSPTSMAFLGPDDILVLEKNNGTIKRITNGLVLPQPVLDVNVASANERGMLGIATSGTSNGSTYVFVYYTESSSGDGEDDCPKPSYCEEWNAPLGNRLYRYELLNNKLVRPQLLLDLPASPGSAHNGGIIIIGPDKNVYATIGDVSFSRTVVSNDVKSDFIPDGRGGILHVTQNGQPIKGSSILNNSAPLNLYYAYGIRNSFGIDFDPVTGNLWDTENGPGFGDEINLVEPGFNSGWRYIQGIWEAEGYYGGNILLEEEILENLANFDGRGKYSYPEFSWKNTVGPTAIKFLSSDMLGTEYKNDLFVASLIPNGNIYHFDLNEDRSSLALNKPLDDGIADTMEELENITFGSDFGGITDLELGPDGYLYIVSYFKGKIFRITPTNSGS